MFPVLKDYIICQGCPLLFYQWGVIHNLRKLCPYLLLKHSIIQKVSQVYGILPSGVSAGIFLLRDPSRRYFLDLSIWRIHSLSKDESYEKTKLAGYALIFLGESVFVVSVVVSPFSPDLLNTQIHSFRETTTLLSINFRLCCCWCQLSGEVFCLIILQKPHVFLSYEIHFSSFFFLILTYEFGTYLMLSSVTLGVACC